MTASRRVPFSLARGVFEVERHVHGHGGDGDFADFFPRHFEVRAAGLDHAHLRIGVARSSLRAQRLGDRIVQGGLAAGHAHGAAEAGLHRALVLIDRVNPHQENAQQEPDEEAKQNSNCYWHRGSINPRVKSAAAATRAPRRQPPVAEQRTLALEVLEGGMAVRAVLERDIPALVVDVQSRNYHQGIRYLHAQGERVGGVALQSGEQIGEQQVTAGQRRKIRQTLFTRKALRAEYLQQGRAGVVVLELDVHNRQQTIALAVARPPITWAPETM